MAIEITNEAGEPASATELGSEAPVITPVGEPVDGADPTPAAPNVDIKDINMEDVDGLGDGEETASTWGKSAPDKDGDGDEGDEGDDKVKAGDAAEFLEGNENASEDETFFGGVADLLKRKGFFSGDTDIKSEEDLASAFEAEIQARLDDTTKQALEYMGMGVPQQEVAQIQKALAETERITVETLGKDRDLAAGLIYSEFKHKGFSDEDAKGYTDMIEKNGQLEAEAVKALATRKANLQGMIKDTVGKYKSQAEAAKAAEAARIEELSKFMGETSIFGKNIGKTTVEKLKHTMNTVVGYTKSGEPVNALMKFKLENPVDFEHKLLYLFTVTDGFKSLSAFDRSAESRVSRRFKDSVVKLNSGKSFSDKQITPKTKIDIDSIDDIV